MNVPADDPRPVTIAVEIAWENAPPRTLGEALSFIRRHLNPEHVFSSAELAGCENWLRFEDLKDRLEDLRGALAEKDRQIEQMRQELGAQNTAKVGPPVPSVGEATP